MIIHCGGVRGSSLCQPVCLIFCYCKEWWWSNEIPLQEKKNKLLQNAIRRRHTSQNTDNTHTVRTNVTRHHLSYRTYNRLHSFVSADIQTSHQGFDRVVRCRAHVGRKESEYEYRVPYTRTYTHTHHQEIVHRLKYIDAIPTNKKLSLRL
jgi:hypothetical protein